MYAYLRVQEMITETHHGSSQVKALKCCSDDNKIQVWVTDGFSGKERVDFARGKYSFDSIIKNGPVLLINYFSSVSIGNVTTLLSPLLSCITDLTETVTLEGLLINENKLFGERY